MREWAVLTLGKWSWILDHIRKQIRAGIQDRNLKLGSEAETMDE